jgi:hypothetical protein
MVAAASAGRLAWVPLENRFYRRTRLGRGVANVDGAIVACAAAGGAVAVVGDGGWGIAWALVVHAAGGAVVARYASLRPAGAAPARAVAVGWAAGDVAVVVYEDGFFVRVRLPAAAVEGRRVGALVAATPAADGGRPEPLFDAVVLPQGHVVVRTAAGRLFCVGADDRPRPLSGAPVPPPGAARGGARAGGTLAATALDTGAQAADVEVLAIGGGGSLTRVSAATVVPVADGKVHVRLALSPDGKFVASLLDGGAVVVRNVSSLAEVVHVVVPAALVPPPAPVQLDNIAWVGSDAVAVTCGATLVLAGPAGEVAPVKLAAGGGGGGSGALVLHTEADGLRVVSAGASEFVQMVPECVEAAFLRPEAPASRLMRAAAVAVNVHALDHAAGLSAPRGGGGGGGGDGGGGNSDGDGDDGVDGVDGGIAALERYRLMTELREGGALGAAARGCVEAAYLVWDPADQKALLSAAAYGQRFALVLDRPAPGVGGASASASASLSRLDSRAASREPDTRDCGVPLAIATIRVLCAARSADTSVPLTKPQLDALGFDGLVRRLSGYGSHALALRLSAFCGLSPSDALAGWAREHLLCAEADDVVAGQIVAMFDETRLAFETGGVRVHRDPPPLVAAADDAFHSGRARCAELLLRREPNAALKVALYLEMRLEPLALLAAIASKDNEVVMDVVEHLLESRSIREVAKLFKTLPASMSHRATDLLVVHLREAGSADAVRTLLSEVGRHREAAMEAVAEADAVQDVKARMAALERAASSCGRSSHRRGITFELQALQLAISSAHNAADMERRNGLEPGSLHRQSSTQLLSVAASMSDPTRRRDALMRLRRELKIPDSRFYWVVLEALAQAGEMPAVEALSNSAGHGRPPPIGLMAFVDVCLRHKQEAEATKYALRIADLRDRARALARCGRGKEAADIASKLRNNQLLEEVSALVARHSSGISMAAARGGRSAATAPSLRREAGRR